MELPVECREFCKIEKEGKSVGTYERLTVYLVLSTMSSALSHPEGYHVIDKIPGIHQCTRQNIIDSDALCINVIIKCWLYQMFLFFSLIFSIYFSMPINVQREQVSYTPFHIRWQWLGTPLRMQWCPFLITFGSGYDFPFLFIRTFIAVSYMINV